MYFGRTVHGESIIRLHHSRTRERIRTIVDAQCQPGIEILDENGNVVDSLPRKDDLAQRVAALEAAVQRLREMVGK